MRSKDTSICYNVGQWQAAAGRGTREKRGTNRSPVLRSVRYQNEPPSNQPWRSSGRRPWRAQYASLGLDYWRFVPHVRCICMPVERRDLLSRGYCAARWCSCSGAPLVPPKIEIYLHRPSRLLPSSTVRCNCCIYLLTRRDWFLCKHFAIRWRRLPAIYFGGLALSVSRGYL